MDAVEHVLMTSVYHISLAILTRFCYSVNMNDQNIYCVVTVENMMAARERRVVLQRKLLRAYQVPIVSLSMNIVGPVKVTPFIERGFAEAIHLVEAQLRRHAMTILEHIEIRESTGCEAYWAVNADAQSLKRRLCEIEQDGPFGRLLDIDVIGLTGEKVSRLAVGFPNRRCLLCDEDAFLCARSRTHSIEALFARIQEILNAHFAKAYMDRIQGMAIRALLYEVSVTPKPGLVDRAHNGAHEDMNFFTFLDSACGLLPYFRACVGIGMEAKEPKDAFSTLRYAGKQADDTMLSATAGINTHRGAIFSLGILLGALGHLYAQGKEADTETLCGVSVQMTREILSREIEASHGPAGARGEAMAGFPSARNIGLPALQKRLGIGDDFNDAGVYALICLIATVEDANVIRRGNPALASEVKRMAQAVLDDYSQEAVQRLDVFLVDKGMSPGGCADILAVSFFLLFLERDRETQRHRMIRGMA